MKNNVKKYGLMIIAAVLLIALAFAGAASAGSVDEIDSADEFYQFVTEVNKSTVVDATYSAQLTGDITLDNKTVFNPAVKTNVILDLNGHVIISTYTKSSSFLLKDNIVLEIYDNSSSSDVHTYTSVTVLDNQNKTGLSTSGGSIIGGGFVWQPLESTIDYRTAGNPTADGDAKGYVKCAPCGKCFQVNDSTTLKIHGGSFANFIGMCGGCIGIVEGGDCFFDGGLITDCGGTIQGGGIQSWGDITISGGTISDCSASKGGAVFCNGGMFKGGTITGCSATYGGGVYISKGTFTLYGGTITDCSATYGGGVYNKGTFTLYGGTITDCSASMSGGGAYSNSGTFTLSGGTITGCSATYGGGVYIDNNGTFTLSGGTITGCSATYGGGVYIGKGTFTLYGGTITDCSASMSGGGAYIYSGVFTLSGGTITGCSATYGGGVYIDSNGTFTLYGGGTITDCSASNSGGGAYIYSGAFTLSEGTVSGCSATYGGGVYIYDGTFTMSGGTISDCIAGDSLTDSFGYGGGVFGEGDFTMSGGTISNCKSFGQSGAINVHTGTTTISGTALIENCYACDCGGGITCISSGILYVKGGTFRNNVAVEDGGAIAVANGKCCVSGGIFENNTAQYGGAINVAYCNPCIITGGIFRDNHDSTGSTNAIATEKRSDKLLPNLIIGGTVTLEGDQSFRLIDLPDDPESFKIGTPTDIIGTSFTDEKFTGSIKNFIIDNESLDGRTLFEIKVKDNGQNATDVLGHLGLKDTTKWTLVANDTSDPKTISVELNKPVASSASVLFSEDNTTAYVNITLTDDNDAASAVVEFWNASGKISSSDEIKDRSKLTKGSTVDGFVVKGLVENYEYTVTANLTMVDSTVIYANYTLGTFNCSNPKITAHPQSAVYKLDAAAEKLTVCVEAVTPTYQWENSTDGKTFNMMIGETYDNITPSTDAIGMAYYRVNVTDVASGKSVYSLAAAVEVYATYQISYDMTPGGENPSKNPTSYSSNESVVLADPVKTYYIGYWNDTSGNTVSEIYKGTTGDISLYANYTPREYYICYIDGGKTTNPASYNITSGTISLTNATKDGYKFIGWYGNAAFTGDKVISISSDEPKDITLYAQWVQQVNKTVDSEGNATFYGDERIATARIVGTQTLLSEVSGLTLGKTITFVKDIPGVSASDLPEKSGYYTNLYSAFEINYDDTLSGDAQVTLKVTLANGDSADSLHALHQGSSGWEDLTDVSKTQSGNEVTIVGNVSSFSPFAVVSYSEQPQQYTPSSSKQTGYTVILQEGQEVPTTTPTVAPTGEPTSATPAVIATAKPTTQATQASPAPVFGILAGLGATALVYRLRK